MVKCVNCGKELNPKNRYINVDKNGELFSYCNSCHHFETIKNNIERINEKIEFSNEKRDYASDIKKYYNKFGVNPYVFVGYLIPVFLESRKASCLFFDEVNFHSYYEILILAKEIKKDYYIMIDFIEIPTKNGSFPLLFFFKDRKYYQEINKLQQYIKEISSRYMKDLDSILDDSVLVKIIGDIIGYPNCCIEIFINMRVKGDNIESKCYEDLSDVNFEFEPITYFSYEFYPCSPSCINAQMIGKNVLNTFVKEDKNLAKSFELITMLNAFRISNLITDADELDSHRQFYDKKILALFR